MQATHVRFCLALICGLALLACGDERIRDADAGVLPSDAAAGDGAIGEGRDGGTPDGGGTADAGAVELPDEPWVNLSALHYSARVVADGTHTHEEEDLDEDLARVPTGTVTMRTSTPPPPSWTSREGRALYRDAVSITSDALAEIDDPDFDLVHGTCATPQYYSSSYAGDTPSGITVATIAAAFDETGDAYNWLKHEARARMPFFLPFRHPDVVLSQGWMYDGGSFHGAQDFARSGVSDGEDSTFLVRAMSWGVVRDVYYSRGGGNIVVIEHTAPTGEKYLSRYMHLRNGRANDIAEALDIDCSDTSGDKAVRCNKYRLYAQNHPDHGGWGTDSQTLRVDVGDIVSAGQVIGWAGNTGVGGAGSGLEDDGTPTDWKGNVHLHSSLAYEHPHDPDSYVIIDPYGVYAKADGERCYDLLKDTEFDRIFAPFFPTFHGVPLEVFVHYFNYYVAMGYGLETMSVHRDGTLPLVSGSFQRGVSGPWAAHVYMNPATADFVVGSMHSGGLVAEQTSVNVLGSSTLRVSFLFRGMATGETVEHLPNLDDPAFVSKWEQRVVDDGWRVADYFGYRMEGSDRAVALFTDHDPRPFYMYRNRTGSQLSDALDTHADDGVVPVSFNAAETADGIRYSALLRERGGCWKLYPSLTPEQYQARVETEVQKGYRVHQVQGYAGSTRYGVIFTQTGAGLDACP